MKNGRRFDRATEAIERLLLRSADPEVQKRTVDAALTAFVERIEAVRARRHAGELLAYERGASFLSLVVTWAGYYTADEEAPADLARAIDARFAGRTGSAIRAEVTLLLYGRRYRELARAGQADRFRDPWTPGPADLEALTAELDAVAPRLS
ncbi:MAG TPA: hypothetical protein VKZ18_24825 [Polyangia bacterium]|nr:hypothetical protein [Polyangia bacterium]